MDAIFIPKEVFENRCRWCVHGRTENGNPGIPREHIFNVRWQDKLPCEILAIAGADKVPGECLSFHQNFIYGICGTCQFSNQFHEGFCTHYKGPKNKRSVFQGLDYTPNGYWQHSRSTCDRYAVNPRLKDWIMKDVLQGKSPANFDPDTWKPLERIEGSPAATQWQKLKEEAIQEEKIHKEEKQLSLF